MIKKITLNQVASYKKSTVLETDKKVNLVYGLNGTGKSVLSDFLSNHEDDRFKNCFIEGLNDNKELLVYNHAFIQDNFFESENLKGIFTLSKENKEAETKILNAEKEIDRIDKDKIEKNKELEIENTAITKKTENIKKVIWQIKTDYSGGDRVLEFCLDGYKGSKGTLFDHIVGLIKPTEKPQKNIDDLKIEIQAISGDSAHKYNELSQITFSSQYVETKTLFSTQIVGNENSSVSQVIKELGNSDWVQMGLGYLPQKKIDENETCPFCQEKTISKSLLKELENYFDASYDADINALKSFLSKYSQAIEEVPSEAIFESNTKFTEYKKDFKIEYNAFIKVIKDNKKLIEDKIKTPSLSVTLENSIDQLKKLNEVIQRINNCIAEHNKNIDQKETVKSKIKVTFWQMMRWDYDKFISTYRSEKDDWLKNTGSIDSEIKKLLGAIEKQKEIILNQQKQTVNIEEAITNINSGLVDLGITDFEIQNHSENLYKIVRGKNEDNIFRSLSEGEKMIISFLYFIELCRGKKDAGEITKKKIIVIDDPISSLSHIFVFNIGRLIKSEFYGKRQKKDGVVTWNYKYEQIFILTHSLYFFYEITETNHDARKESQKLFRLIKNNTGSKFLQMSYEEIQNDYQAYWFIINDDEQPTALIANCMRNIIEYFFNFVEKKDLNNLFLDKRLQENRFQAFYRYINRESHSLGQNIFDFKEFNYNDFKDAFSTLFKVAGYENHYKKMIK